MKNWTENSPPGIKAKVASFSAWVGASRPGLLRPVIAACAFGAYTDSFAIAIGTVAALTYLGLAIAAAGAAKRADETDNHPS